MAKSNTINIAIEVDDKGSVKLRKIGDEAKKSGDQGEKSMGRFRKGIANLDDSMNLALPTITEITVGATALAAATVAGAVAMINSAADQAKEIENLSRLANMGSVDFQNYAYATESVGVSAENLADISKDVQDKLGDFIATGGGEFADFFENVAPKIGLTAEELQGLSGPDILIAVKDGMDAVNLSAEEQIFYLESLGNDASLLTPLLKDNGAALKEQAAEADALGIAISDIESQNLLEAGRATKELEGLFGGLKNKVAAELSPALTDVVGKIVDGMTDGGDGVDTLATKISTGLLQGLGYAVESMRFFHNGWLGIKLVGTAAINAIAQSIEFLFGGVRDLLTPLDLFAEGLVKIGAIDVNPFDGIEESLGTFSASSRDVTTQVLADIDSTNAGYDSIKATIDGYVTGVKEAAKAEKELAEASTQTTAAQEKATETTVANLKYTKSELKDFAKDGEKLGTDMWMAHADASDEARMRGIQALADVEDANTQTAASMELSWTNFAGTAGSSMSTLFVDVVRGDWAAMKEDWSTLWDGMLTKMMDVVAEMAVTWTVSAVGSLFEGWDVYHAGAWNLQDDEVPSILQKGEMVIPKEHATALRENLGNMGIDSSFDDLVASTDLANPEGWGDAFSGFLGDEMAAKMKGGLAGLIGTQDIGETLAGLFSPSGMIGSISSALAKATMSAAGLTGNWASGGYFVGSVLSALGLGGAAVPGAMSLGGFFGAMAGDAIGDAFDAREFEDMRDALRDMGFSPSAIASEVKNMSAYQESLGALTEDNPMIDTVGAMSDLTGVEFGLTALKEKMEEQLLDNIISGQEVTLADLERMTKEELATFISTPAGLEKYGALNDLEFTDDDTAASEARNHAGIDTTTSTGIDPSSDQLGGLSPQDQTGGNSDTGGGGNGGQAEGEGGTGGLGGYSLGGVVKNLFVPDGDDGLGGLRYDEGIVDADTMEILSAQIRSGSFGSQNSQQIVINLNIVAEAQIGDTGLTEKMRFTAKEVYARQDGGKDQVVVRMM